MRTVTALLAMLVLLTSVGLPTAPVLAATVEGVRLWRAPDHTCLVLDLSGPVEHTLFELSAPERIVIDLASSRFGADIRDVDFSESPIEKVRYGTRRKHDLRIVLDMRQRSKPRSFVLERHAGKPDRLVIDLYDRDTRTVKTVDQSQSTHQAKRDILIAIDAGHGGEDPGSVGPKNVYEKDVVLSVSKQLKRVLAQEPGFRATLIRSGDYYVNNTRRRQQAREMRADLFVSIHADGFKDPRARGASVFALSRRGATSQMARILASKANESDLIGGAGRVSLSDKDDVLAGVLVDLSMTATLASSLNVGERVLRNIGSFTKLHKNHVEQAAFIVLKAHDVPSILVEIGFITNPTEAKKLQTKAHQRRLATAVMTGIRSYFYDNPPEGSYVAWQKSQRKSIRYTITRGDTLSSIAQRYKISVPELKKLNQLRDSTIRVGQVLTIPAS